ncbi:hypothetical protein DPMN_163583 [Dreissena polymorpha]|uniref:Uncharacterized protein n=1 Tax=Dreissena polymorpha TaxID=45954 RepID=A0A9D4EX17_DREPO|nr:hypothetical protein DPMN_163583 [Dreissena polymorpha]
MGLNKPYIVERVLVLGSTDRGGQLYNIIMSMGLWTESLQDEQFTFKNATIAEMRLTPPREIQFVRTAHSEVTALTVPNNAIAEWAHATV